MVSKHSLYCSYSWGRPLFGLAADDKKSLPPRLSPGPHLALANATEVRQHLGLTPAYDKVAGVESIKIAILDYGFEGLESASAICPRMWSWSSITIQLWSNASNWETPISKAVRLAAHMATPWPNHLGRDWISASGPKFYLLNANGPTMLHQSRSLRSEAHVDIILFSNVFEGGGYGDGRGPINRMVADALAATFFGSTPRKLWRARL